AATCAASSRSRAATSAGRPPSSGSTAARSTACSSAGAWFRAAGPSSSPGRIVPPEVGPDVSVPAAVGVGSRQTERRRVAPGLLGGGMGATVVGSGAAEERILVVDDDPVSCRLMADVLERAGLVVEWTTAATVALERVNTGRIALVVSDVNMPHML